MSNTDCPKRAPRPWRTISASFPRGAEKDASDDYGYTPQFGAAQSDHSGAVDILMAAAAVVDMRGEWDMNRALKAWLRLDLMLRNGAGETALDGEEILEAEPSRQ
eukprot:g6780.t1